MTEEDVLDGKEEDFSREFRSYVIGGILAIVLTAAAFGLVAARMFDPVVTFAILSTLAVVQIVIHFRYFLHIDMRKSHRDDLQLILFTGLIIFFMTAGTIWILYDQYYRMG